MNFEIKNSKQLKNNIIDISAINISDIIHNIFFDPDYTIYTTKQDKYFGTINKTSLINNFFDQFKSINQNYPVIDQNLIEKFQEIHQLATENQVKKLPIVIDGKINGEYYFLDSPLSIFSMNEERWEKLYSKNTKSIEYINSLNVKKICVCGKFGKSIVDYIKSYNIQCDFIDNSYDTFCHAVKNYDFIIDVDYENFEFKKSILAMFQALNQEKISTKYINLYDFCNNVELFCFAKMFAQNKTKMFFFEFPAVDTFKNLNQQEKYRIAFDKSYRYYYANKNMPEIKNLLKKVLKKDYSDDFIKSRNFMAGLEFKNGICRLLDSNNDYCRSFNGQRQTTDIISYYDNNIYCFGACFMYGAVVSNEYTFPSCMQRLMNKYNKNYQLHNFGARNLLIPEIVRIINTLKINSNDILLFVLTSHEINMLNDFGINENIFNLKEFFDNEKQLHNYFLDEPMHCNYICTKKIANFAFNKIKNILSSKKMQSKRDIQLENKFIENYDQIKSEAQKYIDYLSEFKVSWAKNSSIVLMHANPFTLGHYKLVEYASKHSDYVYVMLALESGMFAPSDVYEMAKESCKDFGNVVVIKDRTDIIPRELFLPGYLERDKSPNACGNTSGFIDFIGKVIKPALDVKQRFVGSEPVDKLTQQMNLESERSLPKYGIKHIEIPRFVNEKGIVYSAKTVRNALKCNDWETIEQLVPRPVVNILHKYTSFFK